MKAHISMASWPGMRHEDAASLLAQRHVEPLFGELSSEHVQLVPQSFGTLSDAIADGLLAMFPSVQFRLHANVRVMRTHQFADLSNFGQHRDWFMRAAQVSQRLHAPAYSAHAGSRSHASLAMMLDNARRCADLFECQVAVEGHYPSKGDALLVSNWGEYRRLFESGVPYALDLSHLNIVTEQSRSRDDGLVAEMLACERCIEVHVSDNDGTGDWHRVCDRQPWWYRLLTHAHPGAILFSEGNHRKRRTIR